MRRVAGQFIWRVLLLTTTENVVWRVTSTHLLDQAQSGQPDNTCEPLALVASVTLEG